ncbi:MAG: NAD-dependent protein deacetylase [Candidatus Accumulibacter sp. UW26]|jgi:NAD-dependent SIR2 family protein deacetylase
MPRPTPLSEDIGRSIERLSVLLRQGPAAVLSGAGLSTASGIPAYRDRDGQWQHTKPILHQEFLRSEALRKRYWARSFIGWPAIDRATPAPGHRALTRMQAQGIVSSVITQNVDGLHQRAGSRLLIELHGGLDRVLCLACTARFPRTALQQWLAAANPDFAVTVPRPAPDGDVHLDDGRYADFQVPACPSCQGILKPDVVFFGDSVPRDRVAAATQAIDAAQTLLVLGSSLMVYSGFRFVDYARRCGKIVVAINQGVTRADHLLDIKIEADCGDVLERLLAYPDSA